MTGWDITFLVFLGWGVGFLVGAFAVHWSHETNAERERTEKRVLAALVERDRATQIPAPLTVLGPKGEWTAKGEV